MGVTTYYTYSYSYNTFDFLAPFIKLRWKNLELTYRGLLGFWEETHNGYRDYNYYRESDNGFDWNQQLMLGLYFATNKRQR